jgi:hypothetical protein
MYPVLLAAILVAQVPPPHTFAHRATSHNSHAAATQILQHLLRRILACVEVFQATEFRTQA